MDVYEDERTRQEQATAQRVAERTEARRANLAALAQPGGLAVADTPERIAKRVDRLSRYYGAAPAKLLEKIINTADFVGVRYLEAGVAAARAVGRVNIRDANGRVHGFGTGSLVSPTLLLTNHHVLPDAETARSSVIEFNFQDGIDGKPLLPQVLALDPDRFFLADDERDFALVAVKATVTELAPFGFNRLIEAEGKAIVGEFVTIVQHPRGEKKQIALRENKIVDVPADFLHYAADTEPGSSGSPVFNDQWEVVALHHASVPAPEHTELGGVMNEGIRVSRILRFVHDQALPPAMRTLADAIFTPERIADVATPAVVEPSTNGAEAISIDPDYADRAGYDTAFLGVDFPAPAVGSGLVPVASPTLPYHHYSVVMHRTRALALFTAVNIDGAMAQRPKRERDRWFLDPRLPAAEQTGEDVYRDNPLDRGHLVRRLDPAWGPTEAFVKIANDDTFHFTNCTPQHHLFNAGHTLWAGLEDYVLGNADNANLRVSVITGPVFADDDDDYRGVKLPRQFWKVVAMLNRTGALSATGYLLSQATLLEGLESVAEFSYGAYRTFQVPVRRIAELTGLGLDAAIAADPFDRQEATVVAPREVSRPEELVL
jgi:endonuclease G